MHLKQLDEADIVAKALEGDTAAFGDLYERYLDPVYHYVFYRVDNREEAEDLTENVFLRAWQAMSRNPPREIPFRLWLYRIANNAVIDFYRARREQVGLEAAAQLPDPVAGPEAELVNWERTAALRQAIHQLKDEQQQVLICRFIVGLSHSETAVVLQRSKEATRALQYRAIVALKKMSLVEVGDYV